MTAPNKRGKKTAQLALAAIGEIGDTNGTSIERIENYISQEYAVPDRDFKRYLVKAIERGVAFGAIRKFRGKYSLGKVFDNAGPTKVRRVSRAKRVRKRKRTVIRRRKGIVRRKKRAL